MDTEPAQPRDPKSLAEAFDAHMRETGKNKLNVKCESEHEAVLVAHEMSKLGWRAKVDKALSGTFDELRVIDVVYVSKKRQAELNPAALKPADAPARPTNALDRAEWADVDGPLPPPLTDEQRRAAFAAMRDARLARKGRPGSEPVRCDSAVQRTPHESEMPGQASPSDAAIGVVHDCVREAYAYCDDAERAVRERDSIEAIHALGHVHDALRRALGMPRGDGYSESYPAYTGAQSKAEPGDPDDIPIADWMAGRGAPKVRLAHVAQTADADLTARVERLERDNALLWTFMAYVGGDPQPWGGLSVHAAKALDARKEE